MILHSIRWRLQLWHGILLLLVLSGFGFTAHRLQRANELRRVDQELQQRMGPLIEALRRPPPGDHGPPGGPPPNPGMDGRDRRPPRWSSGDPRSSLREFRLGPGRAQLFETGANPFYYVIWLADGRELSRSATAPANIPMPEPMRGGRFAPTARLRESWREIYGFGQPGECLLVGRSIAPELAGLRHLALWLVALGGGVLAVGLAGGWWMASRAIRPIREISAAAAKIADGNLSHRINVAHTDDELGRLAFVLNSTFARLEAAFTQQARFTSDASHDLRTPVSVILAQTQTALGRDRSPAEYRETLEACQRAAQRMRQLIESLLQLARFDAGQECLKREAFDLGQTAQDCLELVRPLAGERGVQLSAELDAVTCLGDHERIAQVIMNLLTNAIVHNHAGGTARLVLHGGDGVGLLTVEDSGPGIPPEDLPRIFERFYRADRSRSSTTGGTGLGLAISKAIVEAHAGSIEVTSEPGKGTSFCIRLPLAPSPGA